MSWWGKVVGGTFGFMLGGPLGALMGALWLTAVEGFSYAEVAHTLDSTEKSVKALVHRARSTLASRMTPDGELRSPDEERA